MKIGPHLKKRTNSILLKIYVKVIHFSNFTMFSVKLVLAHLVKNKDKKLSIRT